MATSVENHPPPPSEARQRILDTAYDLFSQRGIRDVGTAELIESADVAKATFYRHFRSKDDLVLAFLRLHEEVWFCDWLLAEARQRGDSPEDQLLVIFDLFGEWFAGDDFEGCCFLTVLLEFNDRKHPVHQACLAALNGVRVILSELAANAGFRDPDGFALSWHILMKGSIVQAIEGDLEAAKRAKVMGGLLIDLHRLESGAPLQTLVS